MTYRTKLRTALLVLLLVLWTPVLQAAPDRSSPPAVQAGFTVKIH